MAQRFRPVIEIEGRASALTHCLRLHVSQSIFDHHRFQIVVPHKALEDASSGGFFQRAHQELCGKNVTIHFEPFKRGGKRSTFQFKGIITRLRLGSTAELANVYIIEGYSPTYLLEGSTQRRSFVKKTLAQICAQVLRPYPANVLKSTVAPLNKQTFAYAAQYQEDNFEFLKRLAAAHGEWLYYTGTELVVGQAHTAAPVPFVVGGVQSFALTVALRPNTFAAAEYDYRQHQRWQASSGAQSVPPPGGLGQFAAQTAERLFDQPFYARPSGHFRNQAQLDEAMGRLKSSVNGSLVVFEGAGETADIAVGGLVAVSQPAPGRQSATDAGQYRVLAVDHYLDEQGDYLNTFRAVPDGRGPAPAPLLPVPHGATEEAEVIDLRDPKRLGRVRVRFVEWGAAARQAESGWLRVLAPYSGDGKGHLFVPELGSRVLVSYEGQDAERPYVQGNVFHHANPQGARYSPSGNGVKGIQTAGGNKFVMLDAAGAQRILISNAHNEGTAIQLDFKGDGSVGITTNGPISLTAGGNITLEAGKNIEMRAGGDISLAAQKNVSVQAIQENLSVRAQKELLLTAVSDDLTLEAASKKFVAKAADNVEIRAVGTAKINGQDLKLNQPG